ncbi:Cystatin, partial [Cuculus canorus]
AAMATARGCAMLLLLTAVVTLVGSAVGNKDREHLVGAPEEILDPEKDEGLQEALRFAVAEYNEGNNDRFTSKVVRIISARRQVVSGLNYTVKVEIAPTTCLKPPSNFQSCPVQPRSKRTICNFTVYVVPWEDQMRLTEHRC